MTRCVVLFLPLFLLATSLLLLDCLANVVPNATSSSSAKHNKFLLILLDGFRWDYFSTRSSSDGFRRLKEHGVHAEYMNSIFPSLSYPSYYSIVTGLHPESHGIVGNTMYDPNSQDKFFMTASSALPEHSHWWQGAEPMWITTTKNELSTFLYLWPGCEVTIRGVRPNSCEPYSKHVGTSRFLYHIEKALDDFTTNAAQVIFIYCEWPDAVGHVSGPESPQMKDAIRAVDEAIGQLLDKIKVRNLTEQLNLVIVSDHGMTRTDSNTIRRISLKDNLDLNDVEYILDRGATVGIYPLPGKIDKVYVDLAPMQVEGSIFVWKKEMIPESLHIKHNNLTAPIVVVARTGYFIEGFINNPKQIPNLNAINEMFWNGFHGYLDDNKDMRAIFLASGPDFKKNYTAPAINMTDPYNVMMKLVGIEPLPNNGSWNAIKDILNSNFTHDSKMVKSNLHNVSPYIEGLNLFTNLFISALSYLLQRMQVQL